MQTRKGHLYVYSFSILAFCFKDLDLSVLCSSAVSPSIIRCKERASIAAEMLIPV